LSEADLVIFVIDGSTGLDEKDLNVFLRIKGSAHITIANKSDLHQVAELGLPDESRPIRVSAKTGKGIDDVESAIRQFLGTRPEGVSDSIMTNARQFENVSAAIGALEKGRDSILKGTPHEMVLLDIYDALSHLNELTGEVVTEDILGRIFSTFCVGK